MATYTADNLYSLGKKEFPMSPAPATPANPVATNQADGLGTTNYKAPNVYIDTNQDTIPEGITRTTGEAPETKLDALGNPVGAVVAPKNADGKYYDTSIGLEHPDNPDWKSTGEVTTMPDGRRVGWSMYSPPQRPAWMAKEEDPLRREGTIIDGKMHMDVPMFSDAAFKRTLESKYLHDLKERAKHEGTGLDFIEARERSMRNAIKNVHKNVKGWTPETAKPGEISKPKTPLNPNDPKSINEHELYRRKLLANSQREVEKNTRNMEQFDREGNYMRKRLMGQGFTTDDLFKLDKQGLQDLYLRNADLPNDMGKYLKQTDQAYRPGPAANRRGEKHRDKKDPEMKAIYQDLSTIFSPSEVSNMGDVEARSWANMFNNIRKVAGEFEEGKVPDLINQYRQKTKDKYINALLKGSDGKGGIDENKRKAYGDLNVRQLDALYRRMVDTKPVIGDKGSSYYKQNPWMRPKKRSYDINYKDPAWQDNSYNARKERYEQQQELADEIAQQEYDEHIARTEADLATKFARNLWEKRFVGYNHGPNNNLNLIGDHVSTHAARYPRRRNYYDDPRGFFERLRTPDHWRTEYK